MRAELTAEEQQRLRRIATGREDGETLPELGEPERLYFARTPDGARAVHWEQGEWQLVWAVIPSSAME